MRRDKKEVRSGQEAGFSAEPTRIDMQSSTRSLDETARQTSTGRRIVGVLASGLGRRSSSHYSPTGSPNSPSLLAKRQFAFPILAVLAVAALGLWLLLPGGALRAQDAAIEYAENGKDPVATFTAEDPEGVTPITWSVLAASGAADPTGVEAGVDSADSGSFTIDEDGMLKFSSPPDYENPPTTNVTNNTYKVVVVAADGTDDSAKKSYYKVTVKVTDVAETGEVSWTVHPDGGDEHQGAMPKLTQFQVGASLMASVSDGDIDGETKTVVMSHDDVDADPTWRWYRSSSKTSTGTMIDGATSHTYTVVPTDVGMYVRAVAYYLVTGNVDQETASLTSDYPVLAVRIGDNKLKFSAAKVTRNVSEGKKGANVGAPVTATGNHGAVNYTLAGDVADNAKFDIDQKTGQITTDVNLDYDAVTDDQAGNCRDADFCTVNVRATDASGDATATNAATNMFVDATVTIKVTDVNEKPDFNEGTAGNPSALKAIKRDEGNTTLFDDAVTDGQPTTAAAVTYMATDPEGRALTYRLMGPDGAKFQLSALQVLSFKTKPDYEKPTDRNKDKVYEVTVRASDGTLHTDRMVKVTVINVDDAPTVSGPSSKNYAENGKGSVATFTAEDPEGATPITWEVLADDATTFDDISGVDAADAVDAADFTIDKDGMLKFDGSPDFENPMGGATSGCNVTADPNPCTNTYKVVVAAADAAATVTDRKVGYYKVTVKVTNVAETGKVSWTVDHDGNVGADMPKLVQFQVGAILTASVEDGDVAGSDKDDVKSLVWRWYRGGNSISGAESDTYTVDAADVRGRLRAEATYNIEGSTSQETASLTSDHPVLTVRFGDNELEFDPAEVSREVPEEGKKGADVGAPVTATGNHGAVNYTLGDNNVGVDNANFEIDQKTGQITTKVELDYEAAADADNNCVTQNECKVTVSATDASGEAAPTEATVTIKLKDVDEKPKFITDTSGTPAAASPKAIKLPEDQTSLSGAEADGFSVVAETGVAYAAEDPEGLNVNLTLMGPDAAKFSLSSAGVLSFKAEHDYEMPADTNKDNVYEVTVRASDGALNEDQMVKVTVSNVDEAPEIIASGLAISGPSSRDYAEDDTAAVGTYTARGENAASARWTLEGDDAMYFKVGTARGAMTELMFKSAPDYEMPRGRAMSDANTNVYMVTLKATEGTDMDTHEVTVTVINVDEMGMVAAISGAARVDSELTAGMVTDPDGSVSGERWTWERSMNGTAWSAISGATLSTYTAMAGDVGYYLRVSVTYTDGQGSGKMAMSAMTAKVVAVGAVDPLITRYAGDDGVLQKSEMIDAINDHVFGDGDDRISKDDMIKVINLHVFG